MYRKRSASRRRKYPRMSRMSRRIKKKTVIGRKKLTGSYTKTNNRKEIKFTSTNATNTATITSYVGGTVGYSIVFQTNQNNNALGISSFPLPAQGTGFNAYIGQRYNTKFLDIRFTMFVGNVVTFQDSTRMLVVSQRNEQALLPTNLFTSYVGGYPISFNVGINSKFWKIHYDKIYNWSTGLTDVVNNVQTIQTQPRHIRLVIPFKHTVTATAAAAFVPDRQLYIILMGYNGANIAFSQFAVRLYFVDP